MTTPNSNSEQPAFPKAELIFSKNDAISLMHQDTASSLRMIADHIEKYKHKRKEIIILLRELADEKDAQSVVVNLRDQL